MSQQKYPTTTAKQQDKSIRKLIKKQELQPLFKGKIPTPKTKPPITP